MAQLLAGPLQPFKALADLTAGRFVKNGAVDSEGLLTCTTIAADTDFALGVPDDAFETDDTALLAATPGDHVELEVRAAVAANDWLMLDTTATFEGTVKPATTGKQVVARALEAQPTATKKVRAKLMSPFFLP